ncbi:TonB-dependent receptor [Bergeyella sp. RCAD1439]|uniref:TonB-dependent receptor n=1 Tax=Bergeyella anatis TaxID=3113737 RepID=UPI002E17A159|nr:TonB-dependent receptor [Bergeyella sp. RCAD1439]
MNKRFKIASVVLMSCAVQSFWAQSVKGYVKDGDGKPVAGVSVSAEGTDQVSFTDGSGSYILSGLKPGNTNVVFSQKDYKTTKKTVVLQEGQVLVLDVVMDEDKYAKVQEVVITGVLNPKSKIASSVSVSSVNSEIVEQSAPRATAEVFRSIPGIKSESTGGEGNANITVRGIPVASGGGKFLQLHEDGLPVMQFGDVAFGNSDIFLRYDQTVSRVEAIRGGSASTLASNSPAGIINFISKNGKKQGGSLMHTVGLDYQNNRTDFEYGMPITNTLSMHVGGFYRVGEGPRRAGYAGNDGGQFKANITKTFNKGYVRLYFKHLNDRAIGYLPMPAQVTGTNSDPKWSSLAGFNLLRDTQHSALFLDNLLSVGADGRPRTTSLRDGMRPVSTAIGAELSFNLGSGWKLEERFRQNFISGRFVSPFPDSVGSADSYATMLNVNQLTYANGPNAGQTYSGPAMRMALFDVDIHSFNNFTNDFKITKKLGDFNFSGGYYRAVQNISMSWLWTTYLMEVKGNNAALLNAGNLSTNGLLAYGVPQWGNCCTRNYDAVYDIQAPYVGGEYKASDRLNFDASARYDFGTARGSYAGAKQVEMDVNQNGIIEANEASVSVIDYANKKPINYDFNYLSYSLGANYMFNPNQSVFVRHSKGGRANADRLLFTGAILASGNAVKGLSADRVTQTEIGFKHRRGDLSLFATGFMANTTEQNWDFAGASPREIQRKYRAIGAELEAYYRISNFDLGGSMTWTDAKIVRDVLNPVYEGNRPRRQAALIYNANAGYKFGGDKQHVLGFSVIGTTSSYAQDNNSLIMPGYAYFNPFVKVEVVKNLSAALNVNNVFNTIGITEAEEGSITAGATNYVRARSINGRTTSLTLAYKF